MPLLAPSGATTGIEAQLADIRRRLAAVERGSAGQPGGESSNAVLKTIFNQLGDLLVGIGPDALAALPAPTVPGFVLATNPAAPHGVEWTEPVSVTENWGMRSALEFDQPSTGTDNDTSIRVDPTGVLNSRLGLTSAIQQCQGTAKLFIPPGSYRVKGWKGSYVTRSLTLLTINTPPHDFVEGEQVYVTGTPPAPLANGTPYYVKNLSATTLQLSATQFGTAIPITGNGSATTCVGSSNPFAGRVELIDNTHIIGAGMLTRIFTDASFEGSMITNPAGDLNNVVIEDVYLDGENRQNSLNSLLKIGLQSAGENNDIHVRNVTALHNDVNGWTVQIQAVRGSVTGCYIGEGGKDGLNLSGSQLVIAHNHVINATDDSITMAQGVDDCVLVGNYVAQTPDALLAQGRGIWLGGGLRNVISGNYIRGAERSGIELTGQAKWNDITGNVIVNPGENWDSGSDYGHGIHLMASNQQATGFLGTEPPLESNDLVEHNNITGNVVLNPRKHGIYIDPEGQTAMVRRNNISDNIVVCDDVGNPGGTSTEGVGIMCDLARPTFTETETNGSHALPIGPGGTLTVLSTAGFPTGGTLLVGTGASVIGVVYTSGGGGGTTFNNCRSYGTGTIPDGTLVTQPTIGGHAEQNIIENNIVHGFDREGIIVRGEVGRNPAFMDVEKNRVTECGNVVASKAVLIDYCRGITLRNNWGADERLPYAWMGGALVQNCIGQGVITGNDFESCFGTAMIITETEDLIPKVIHSNVGLADGPWQLGAPRFVDVTVVGNILNATFHGLSAGDEVNVSATVYPSGLAPNVPYYLVAVDHHEFQLSTIPGGSAQTLSGTGTDVKVHQTANHGDYTVLRNIAPLVAGTYTKQHFLDMSYAQQAEHIYDTFATLAGLMREMGFIK